MNETLILETLAPRRRAVQLPDGTETGLLDPLELSFYDRAEISRMIEEIGSRHETLMSAPTQAKAEKLRGALRDLVRKVLPDATVEQIAALEPPHLDQVSTVFLGEFARMTRRGVESSGLAEILAEVEKAEGPTSAS